MNKGYSGFSAAGILLLVFLLLLVPGISRAGGDDIWIGSFSGDRIAIQPLKPSD